MGRLRVLKIATVFTVLAGLLSGCYFPVRFDAEITLTRSGFYDIKFDGYVVETELYRGLRDGTILPPEESERSYGFRKDLAREEATRSIQYQSKGIFRLNWQKSGDLLKHKAVTFLRRNSKFFTLRYDRDKSQILFQATKLGKEEAARLVEAGLGVEGEIRFITAAPVVAHNATRVADAKERGTAYIWDIRSVADLVVNREAKKDPAPFLAIAM